MREDYRYLPQQQSELEVKNINSYLGYAIAASIITVRKKNNFPLLKYFLEVVFILPRYQYLVKVQFNL